MHDRKLRCLWYAGIATLAMGLMSIPAMADPESFINASDAEYQYETPDIAEFPPASRSEVEKILKKRKSVYQRCQVSARACGINCVRKYREKEQQALCFKANRCQSTWDKCVGKIQNDYPVDFLKEGKHPKEKILE